MVRCALNHSSKQSSGIWVVNNLFDRHFCLLAPPGVLAKATSPTEPYFTHHHATPLHHRSTKCGLKERDDVRWALLHVGRLCRSIDTYGYSVGRHRMAWSASSRRGLAWCWKFKTVNACLVSDRNISLLQLAFELLVKTGKKCVAFKLGMDTVGKRRCSNLEARGVIGYWFDKSGCGKCARWNVTKPGNLWTFHKLFPTIVVFEYLKFHCWILQMRYFVRSGKLRP